MLVPVILNVSPIHGLGIFAARPIPRGEHVWRYSWDIDTRIYGCHRGNEVLDNHIQKVGYRIPETDCIEVPGDLACFWNHSDEPNCGDRVPYYTIAMRDIDYGEELTIDYRKFTDGTLCGAFLAQKSEITGMTEPIRPWQTHLMDRCPPSSFGSIPQEYRGVQWGHWRGADYEAFSKDVMECYGPVAAVTLSMAYKPKTIVEMGVYSGHTSFVLARANPDAMVHGVDCSMMASILPTATTLLTHGTNNFKLHIGCTWDFEMPDVDLCFIDGCHVWEAPYLDSLRAWKNRNTSRDWCIAWDDYHPNNHDVVRCVDRFVKEVGMELRTLMSWVYIGTLPHSAVEAFL